MSPDKTFKTPLIGMMLYHSIFFKILYPLLKKICVDPDEPDLDLLFHSHVESIIITEEPHCVDWKAELHLFL